MDVIEEIYQNSLQPSARSMHGYSKYKCAKNQVKQYYQVMCERFSKGEIELLNEFISCYDEKTKRFNVHCFTAGFKKGLKIAVKSLK